LNSRPILIPWPDIQGCRLSSNAPHVALLQDVRWRLDSSLFWLFSFLLTNISGLDPPFWAFLLDSSLVVFFFAEAVSCWDCSSFHHSFFFWLGKLFSVFPPAANLFAPSRNLPLHADKPTQQFAPLPSSSSSTRYACIPSPVFLLRTLTRVKRVHA